MAGGYLGRALATLLCRKPARPVSMAIVAPVRSLAAYAALSSRSPGRKRSASRVHSVPTDGRKTGASPVYRHEREEGSWKRTGPMAYAAPPGAVTHPLGHGEARMGRSRDGRPESRVAPSAHGASDTRGHRTSPQFGRWRMDLPYPTRLCGYLTMRQVQGAVCRTLRETLPNISPRVARTRATP